MRSQISFAFRWGLLLTVVLFGVAAFVGSLRDRRGDQVGPLVRRIQSIGELHTVRYGMKDLIRHESALEPPGWAAALPGAASVCRFFTSNRVLVGADGTIEAGVDLSRLTADDVTEVSTPHGSVLRVRLPEPVLYAPNVQVWVEQERRGLLWRDSNIVPRAEAEARRLFLEAARRDGILAQARANAITLLSNLQRVVGNRKVEFYFDSV